MNFDFFQDLWRQLKQIWREIKTYQKFTVLTVAVLLLSMLTFLMVNATHSQMTPLYTSNRLLISDAAEIKAYLDTEQIAYKVRGDTLILVAENQVHKIRMSLAAIGLPKMHNNKGFELFDANTWIKGEKELQVLEMRALKGQLEIDISQYENINNASVILDISPPRPFGGSMYKTKASVILNLMPGARLTTSQLMAITFHIAGAVRGLQPNMVAISDTSGKLYQSIDPNGSIDMLRSAEIAVEERLKAKIDGMLAMIVGLDNFYSTVQVSISRKQMSRERKIYSGNIGGQQLGEAVVMSVTESGTQMTERERAEQGIPGTNSEAIAGALTRGSVDALNRNKSRSQRHKQLAVPIDHTKINTTPGEVESISIGVLIDKTITIQPGADIPKSEMSDGRRDAEKLKKEIENQLATILEGYNIIAEPAVDFVEFDKTRYAKKAKEESWNSIIAVATNVMTITFVIFTVLGMFWTFNKFWKRHMLQPPTLEKEEESEEMLEFTTEPSPVEVEAMVESIKTRFQKDPEAVIATILDLISEEDKEDIGKRYQQ